MITILMVEDDAEITLLLKQYLPKYGIDIFTVLLPSVALEKLEIERYDLVLLDLGLPEMDGLELCNGHFPPTPHKNPLAIRVC